MPLSAGTYSNWLPPSSLWVWSFYYFCWVVFWFFLLVFALDRPVPTPRRSWCHKQGLSVGSFLGPSRAVCFTGNGVQRRNSIRMELTSWWRTNMWAGPWGQPRFSLLFWSSWIKAGTRWPWRSFPTKMTLWFSLLGVIRPHRFASRFSCGAFQVKTGELHVFDLICLTQARHFWGRCATAAPCPQLQGLTAWSWDTAPLRLLKQSPTDSRSCIGICFSSFLVWSEATGDFLFFSPWKNSSVWFEKGWGQEVAGKGCLIVFLVSWLLFCTCTRLPLVRTGALLGSQIGAVAEETSSSLQSHPVFSFSLCHHLTKQNPELTLHICTAIHPCVPGCCHNGKVAVKGLTGRWFSELSSH